MAGLGAAAPAILVLGDGSLAAARRVRGALPGAAIHGLSGRVTGADAIFTDFGDTLRQLFADDIPTIAFCAAGIVIRALAPLLADKRGEPPVLAVAEDGSAVVPLLGGLRGVNALARTLGEALGTAPAITTTGEVRFGAALENPPEGYELRNPGDAKRVMSDLLAGDRVRLSGDAPWLTRTRLPFASDGNLSIAVTAEERGPAERELIFHPRSVAVALVAGCPDLPRQVGNVLGRLGLSPRAVAAVVAAERHAAQPEIHAVAAALERPLRLVEMPAGSGDDRELIAGLIARAVPDPIMMPAIDRTIGVAVAASPIAVTALGRSRGHLAVVGLGPGGGGWMIAEARKALTAAQDIIGYETYLRMAGPFRAEQTAHPSDNRAEIDRARHALALAARGRRVAIVSSGDPGVFAMASAVMEALDGSDHPAWHGVELGVIPGVSAAHAAAARAGAPLGHDFCVLSLSDNLKPWAVIERRLALAAEADLVLALYNPVSRARPWQLGRAAEIVRRYRAPATPVVLGRDLGRPGESIRALSLAELSPADADMRTIVVIGSSTTRVFPRADGGRWVYTPRRYEEPLPPISDRTSSAPKGSPR
ncbi:MAG TPA: precorrin-3B C(17)-methyltransferase [Stellaceae bacterium]|jgi:cobalt-precorrin 5A hydrolase/precorrin-3B C17-methyltransferase